MVRPKSDLGFWDRQNRSFSPSEHTAPRERWILLPKDASFSATTGSIPKSLTPFDISVSSSTSLCQKLVDGAPMDRQTPVDQNDPFETGQKRSRIQQLHRHGSPRLLDGFLHTLVFFIPTFQYGYDRVDGSSMTRRRAVKHRPIGMVCMGWMWYLVATVRNDYWAESNIFGCFLYLHFCTLMKISTICQWRVNGGVKQPSIVMWPNQLLHTWFCRIIF